MLEQSRRHSIQIGLDAGDQAMRTVDYRYSQSLPARAELDAYPAQSVTGGPSRLGIEAEFGPSPASRGRVATSPCQNEVIKSAAGQLYKFSFGEIQMRSRLP